MALSAGKDARQRTSRSCVPLPREFARLETLDELEQATRFPSPIALRRGEREQYFRAHELLDAVVDRRLHASSHGGGDGRSDDRMRRKHVDDCPRSRAKGARAGLAVSLSCRVACSASDIEPASTAESVTGSAANGSGTNAS